MRDECLEKDSPCGFDDGKSDRGHMSSSKCRDKDDHAHVHNNRRPSEGLIHLQSSTNCTNY